MKYRVIVAIVLCAVLVAIGVGGTVLLSDSTQGVPARDDANEVPATASRGSAGGDDAPANLEDETGRREQTAGDGAPVEDSREFASFWRSRYGNSADYYSFAREAAEAALAGDTKAQYYLSQALTACHVAVGLTAPYKEGTLEAAIEASLAELPGLSEIGRRKIRSRVMRCEGFFDADALAELPLPEQARSHEFWLDRAAAANEPLALMDQAIDSAVRLGATDDADTKSDLRAGILDAVRVAVESREAAALAKIGTLYSMRGLARKPSAQGPAWMMAACTLGYDCTMRNPDILGRGCETSGLCGGATLMDIYQRDLGDTTFASAYAASQDIVYKVEQGDWEGLRQYLEMRE